MKTQSEVRFYAPCAGCTRGSFRIDHLKDGQVVGWTCQKCYSENKITRLTEVDVEVVTTGKKQSPITVTLRSQTTPPIEVRLNAWKYAHSENDSPEDFFDHQKYFYEEHTCPTNWVSEIEEIVFEGDHDPHGLFELVSIAEGHYKDPNVIGED